MRSTATLCQCYHDNILVAFHANEEKSSYLRAMAKEGRGDVDNGNNVFPLRWGVELELTFSQ